MGLQEELEGRNVGRLRRGKGEEKRCCKQSKGISIG